MTSPRARRAYSQRQSSRAHSHLDPAFQPLPCTSTIPHKKSKDCDRQAWYHFMTFIPAYPYGDGSISKPISPCTIQLCRDPHTQKPSRLQKTIEAELGQKRKIIAAEFESKRIAGAQKKGDQAGSASLSAQRTCRWGSHRRSKARDKSVVASRVRRHSDRWGG